MNSAEADELLDVLDSSGERTGITRTRFEVHRDGDWHRAVHLWLVTGEGSVLLQRRSRDKDLEPGLVDVSVGGHLQAGEDWLAVLREAEEELSVELRPDQLELLTEVRSQRHYPDSVDREFQDVYFAVHDAPLTSYRPRCEEVSVLYEVPLAAAIRLYADGEPVAAAGFDCQGRRNDALLYGEDLIGQAREETAAALRLLQARLGESRGA